MNPEIIRPDSSSEFWTSERCFILESSNSESDPDVSIARARVAVGETTRWHRVIDTTERYYILRGRGVVEVGELPPKEVQEGDVVLIPPSCAQRIANVGDEELLFLAICSPRFRSDAYEELESDGA